MTEHASSHQTGEIVLRDVADSDLPLFFAMKTNAEANYMAGFTAKDPSDHTAFMAHWKKIMANKTFPMKTILFNGQVVGHVMSYRDEEMEGPEVTYWIDRKYWGQGIATRALMLFLNGFKTRPVYGRALKDNVGSLRVMEKCGFMRVGEGKGFANARGKEVEEFILRLG